MKKRDNIDREALAAVRKQARDATSGAGIPGRYNPTRSVRFANRKTDRRAARGRTWKD